MRLESRALAFCSSARRVALSPRPPRLMKYVNMRMPEDGPLGETLFEASDRAMAVALLVKSPLGGCVESVVTVLGQRFFFPVDFFDGIKSDLARVVPSLAVRLAREGNTLSRV